MIFVLASSWAGQGRRLPFRFIILWIILGKTILSFSVDEWLDGVAIIFRVISNEFLDLKIRSHVLFSLFDMDRSFWDLF